PAVPRRREADAVAVAPPPGLVHRADGREAAGPRRQALPEPRGLARLALGRRQAPVGAAPAGFYAAISEHRRAGRMEGRVSLRRSDGRQRSRAARRVGLCGTAWMGAFLFLHRSFKLAAPEATPSTSPIPMQEPSRMDRRVYWRRQLR